MATYDLGKVVGDAGEKGDDGSTVWNTSTAPTYANSKYTFNISNLSGKTGLTIAVNDIIFYSTYYYIVSAVGSTTVDCNTRVNIKGSDASVTIVDNLTSTSSTSALSAKQGKVLNDNKVETSAIATSWGGTTSDSKVPSEKLTKDTLDTKIAKSSTSGLVKNDGTIDTSTYLTSSALSNYVQKSSTNGLLKNDGTVDTTSYSTFSGSYNDLSNKPTIPSASSTTPSADTTSGSYGSGTSYARSNHTHPKSSLYAEATHSHTKSQISDFPSIPSKTSDLTNDGADGTNVFVANNDSRLSDARTPTSHAHGNLTNDGKVGSTANYFVYTTTSGAITSKQKIGNITTSGAIGSTANKPLITTTNGVITTGSFGTTENTFCQGNDSRLSDARTPTAHTHTVSNITDFPTIPTKISDLTNDSDFIEKSNTSGLIKNDGTIDTTSYSTFSGSYNDLSNKPSIPSQNVYYGTCRTGATTQVKVVTATGWSFTTGNILFVKFDANNTYNGTAQIKIGDVTKDIATVGTTKTSRYFWKEGEVVGFVYDGTNMVMFEQGNATTTYYGVTKLSSSTSSTSEVLSATPKAVKTAYDLANGKADAIHTHTVSDVTDFPSIPSSSSDLTDGSDLVKKSSTTGLLKNDGSVMTGGTGSSNYAIGNHTHSGYVSATKVTSWQSTPSDSNVPSEKLVKDYVDGLIGSAISYIVGSGN